jgi:hypothetical protein
MTNSLKDLYYSKGFDYYPTDKGIVHCYIDVYDELFLPYKDKNINILEVGVHEGGSIRLWNEYFTNAKIFGYDVDRTARPNIFNKNVTYIIKNANHIEPDEFKHTPLTIAIDDGSHSLYDQLNFVKLIYNQVVSGGLLIVEDIQDLESQKSHFEALGYPFEIIDLRSVNKRYDDVLLVFKK